MSTLISFDETGKIVGCGVGPRNILEEAVASTEFAVIYDGSDASEETHYVEDGALVEKPAKPSSEHIFDYASKQWVYDVSQHRYDKWSEIKQARSAEEFGTFVWNDYTFDCDEVSQRRIQGAVQLAGLDTNTVMDWTLADNTVQTFNATELQHIGQALAAHVNACHVKGREKRAAIDAATTEAELDAITW
jgi:hypothetical protein